MAAVKKAQGEQMGKEKKIREGMKGTETEAEKQKTTDIQLIYAMKYVHSLTLLNP